MNVHVQLKVRDSVIMVIVNYDLNFSVAILHVILNQSQTGEFCLFQITFPMCTFNLDLRSL